MKLSQFKFKLPEEKIALYPTTHRDESRLMVVHRKTGEIEHKTFKGVLDYFDDKDVFVFNDTKKPPATDKSGMSWRLACVSRKHRRTG